MEIRIEGLTHAYGAVTAVEDLSIDIAHGELLVLLGPSGCGKTSTMRCVVGLESPVAGKIWFGDRPMFDSERGIHVPANKRGAGMVFQSYAIWPHKTVYENVAFPLQVQRTSRGETRERVEEALGMVGLAGYGERGASDLSGGQMQRVALARSVVTRPTALLLDEPLSNLDAKLRERLRVELRQIQQQLGITTVYVTHDQGEALALADRIAVMDEGRIIRLDDAVSLYRRPGSRFVAGFLGSSNLLDGTVVGTGRTLTEISVAGTVDGSPFILRSEDEAPASAKVSLSIRPEDIVVLEQSGMAVHPSCKADVQVVNFLGSQVHYLVETEHGIRLEVLTGPRTAIHQPGTTLQLGFPAERVQVLTG